MIETSTTPVRNAAVRLPALGPMASQAPADAESDAAPVRRSQAAGSAILQHLRQRALGTLPAAAADQHALYLQALRKDELQMANQQASVLQALLGSPVPHAADDGDADAARIVSQVRGLVSDLLTDTLQDDAAVGESNRDFFERIAALLGRLDTEWVQKFSDALAGYVEIFAKLNEVMLLLSRGALGKPDSDGNIPVRFEDLRQELTTLRNELLKKGLGPEFADDLQASAFLEQLGNLNGLRVMRFARDDPDNPGEKIIYYQVGVDPNLVTSLITLFSVTGPLSPTQLSTLLSNKDSAMEAFNQLNRALPEKLQQLMRLWDTLQKVLSSSIETMNEGNMASIRNIGG